MYMFFTIQTYALMSVEVQNPAYTSSMVMSMHTVGHIVLIPSNLLAQDLLTRRCMYNIGNVSKTGSISMLSVFESLHVHVCVYI